MAKTVTIGGHVTQCRRPHGWLGRLILRNMNSRHSGDGLGLVTCRWGSETRFSMWVAAEARHQQACIGASEEGLQSTFRQRQCGIEVNRRLIEAGRVE